MRRIRDLSLCCKAMMMFVPNAWYDLNAILLSLYIYSLQKIIEK